MKTTEQNTDGTLTLEQRTLALFREEKQTMDTVFNHVANGGSVIDLAETWGVRYSDIARWLYEDPVRKSEYENALQAQTEWVIRRILKELQDIGMVDPREAFDDNGNLRDINSMPKALANSIASFEVVEEFQGKGSNREKVGFNKKVKFWDKLRAIELLGKNLKMFSDRVEHSGKITLEALIKASIPKQIEEAKGPLGLGEKPAIEVNAEPISEPVASNEPELAEEPEL